MRVLDLFVGGLSGGGGGGGEYGVGCPGWLERWRVGEVDASDAGVELSAGSSGFGAAFVAESVGCSVV